jgi:adenylosuccinate synthase
MSGKVSVVVGGQFGSEAKGAVAGFLASDRNWWTRPARDIVCVRVGGPNAGHTVYGTCPTECHQHIDDEQWFLDTGHVASKESWWEHPWRLRQIPVAAVTNPDARLLIAAGSEVDMAVLREEWRQLNSAGYNLIGRMNIDYSATLLEEQHITEEMGDGLNGRIGSTAKGIGAARAARIWRKAQTMRSQYDVMRTMGILLVDSTTMLSHNLEIGKHVVIEGTQGYGLGLHTEFYPQVTSGDCRAIDFLAQCGLSPWAPYVQDLDVWVVARTYPIRVAGNSGPLSGETSWDELGLAPEKTTVTKKVRRVGEWDSELVRRAVIANGGGYNNSNVRVALMMADYKIPGLKGARSSDEIPDREYDELHKLVSEVEEQVDARVGLVGTGPTSILDLRGWNI